MKSLLVKDSSLNLQHIKWFRSLVNSNITLKDQIYQLQKTENKRTIIYDKNKIAVSSEAFSLKNTPSNSFNLSNKNCLYLFSSIFYI